MMDALVMIVNILTIAINVILVGLCIKLYTEFVKEKKYRK